MAPLPRGLPGIVFTKKLNVDAACVSGYNADPAPNVIIVSVTYGDGKPVTGLKTKDFTLVNYSMTDVTARLTQPSVIELINELATANIHGVYKVETGREPYITGEVGQTVYVVKISKAERSFIFSTRYIGQTVVSVVMQRGPNTRKDFYYQSPFE